MVTFNFTYQPGISLQQMIGFEMAGRLWSTYLTDPVTVNIHVGTSNLDQGILAGALSGYKTEVPYTGFETNGLRSYIQNDAKSQDDLTAYNTIANSNNSGAFLTYDASGQALGARITNGTSVVIPRANAKALNVPLENTAELDGYIIVNQTVRNAAGQVVPWNYNYGSATVPNNTIDFVSVAAHEIGHVLGFISGVDRPWKFTVAGSNSLSSFLESRPLFVERLNESTPLDLFRTFNVSNISSNVTRERSIGGSPFLSLSNGDASTALGYFATGKDTTQGGNGFQASHWRGDGTSSGLMNATLSTGRRAGLTNLDLRAFDVIGWDRSNATASTSLNWSTLLNQARQGLANRIGRTTNWLDSNTTDATRLLSQNRLTDVTAMVDANPDIYEGRKNSSGGGSWQQLFSLLSEQGLFDSLDPDQPSKPQATPGADLLAGSTDDDVLAGQRGHDRLIGFRGSDQLAGNRGQDVLLGNLGRDQLLGGAGNDLLVGGQGSDRLVGGLGKDIFVIQNRLGMDEVMDFVDGQDQLLLDEGLQFGQLTITQQGNDTLIRLEQKSLMLLQGVNADQITIADFA